MGWYKREKQRELYTAQHARKLSYYEEKTSTIFTMKYSVSW
ncbi:MAG: hypothetical protein ACXADU_03655 [Promethearchaeota archaeon]